MARYQIRTPDPVNLEDIIEQLAKGAWDVMNAWHAFDHEASGKAFEQFREGIRSTLEPCVKTYKLCGLSNLCLDEVNSTPWSLESHVLDAAPTDLVYHLYATANPEEFLKKLAEGALQPIELLIRPEWKEEALSSLRLVFREMLGKYIYSNSVCGKTELCALSSQAPINVWGRK